MTVKPFPKTIIIVGAGVFGLSTALAITRRHPFTKVTIIDRLTPPVEDGTSVDTTRCIRTDPIYNRLSATAQELIKADKDLSQFYHEQGMSFICDGKLGRFYDIWRRGLENVAARQEARSLFRMGNREEVYRNIHGAFGRPPTEEELGRESNWNSGYCNLKAGFIEARECIRVYYERCLASPTISFECGTPVQRLLYGPSGAAQGVILEDGRVLHADTTLIAAGAWSNKLVYLEGLTYSTAIEVAWIKLTSPEAARWRNMPITTNLSTGFNLFPPLNGEIKCLRRSAGYCNTVAIPHPENNDDDKNKTIHTSLPRTTVDYPTDIIPADASVKLRDDLREIIPTLADRKFHRTKLCWLSQTPDADFLIAPHPRIANLHLATGGSAHAWKFLTTIGDFVVDSMCGTLDPVLAGKWAWKEGGEREGDGGNAPRMGGRAQELGCVVRTETGTGIGTGTRGRL
ncbi:MAG: hypothetical protein M1834_002370 [Cirrosporium novae-zelandiae]|nr:MAG: hypothetical protein M1834_002370 [Cirrosporium novae-zelandiae]